MIFSRSIRNCLIPVIIAVCFCSCLSLKEVGAFSAGSQKIFQGTEFTYGYYEYCYDSCYIYNKSARYLKDVDCDCSRDTVLDTLLRNEFAILGAYYAGLTKLSGIKTISFAALGKSVSAGTYGSITVSKTESAVFNGLSTAATNLVTVKYKTRKIKEIVSRYNKDVTAGISAILLHLDNLKGKIGLMQNDYRTSTDLLLKKTTDEHTRWAIININKQKSMQLAKAILFYDNTYQVIKRINDGEALLMTNIDHLKDDIFKQKILSIASDIITLTLKPSSMGTPNDAVFANQLGHFYQAVATRIGDYIHQNIDEMSDSEATILGDDQSRITSYANTFYTLSDKIAFENSGPSFQHITDATTEITAALHSIAKTNKLINIAGGVITLAASVLTGNVGGIAGSLAALIADIAAAPDDDDD